MVLPEHPSDTYVFTVKIKILPEPTANKLCGRPDIQFSTCFCVNIKQILRNPTLLLLRESSDSDYAGCNMNKKSTSGACQLLGGKLVCWSAKKQQSLAMSSVEVEYVADAGCCANIPWMRTNPKESHLIVVKRIFRKSTLGTCQLLGGKLVCWSAKKQQSVAMSSVEVEYVADAGCCANIPWMRSKLTNYDIVYEKVLIFCDNKSAIAISNNLVLRSRTKHIDI
nr:hypothetical protein [Tanacetum cinerariifolium]